MIDKHNKGLEFQVSAALDIQHYLQLCSCFCSVLATLTLYKHVPLNILLDNYAYLINPGRVRFVRPADPKCAVPLSQPASKESEQIHQISADDNCWAGA